jgi:glycosyltransferase involved in cell wall biosynthesis
VLPICLDFERYREPASPVLRRMLEDGATNLLFVGRLAPNKRPEDLIRLASYWRRFLAQDVRLVLVGKPPRRSSYFDALQALAYEEGFTPTEVMFLGHVAHDELLACYQAARVFVSMSEHEGFGVPLVESMLMRVPVLAYSVAAVPYTLGGAGVRFAEKRLAEVAEIAHALATDEALRAAVLAGQDRRLKAFSPERVLGSLRGYVESM